MNKQRFIKTLKDFNNIPDDDRNKLHELAKNYPYSQIIHTLVAKANHDAETSIASQTLHYAAFYATDRHVLREIIQRKASKIVEEEPVHQDYETETSPVETEAVSDRPITVNLPDNDDRLHETLLSDLESLQKSKASYLEWLESSEMPQESEITETREEQQIHHQIPTPEGHGVEELEPEAIQEVLPKQEEAEPAPDQIKPDRAKKEKPKTPKVKKAKSKEKTSRKGKSKKLEQDEIIEKFINKEPSISARPVRSTESQPDLSAASTSFNEDLVSENLAQIFVNQGKKNKAIDIYKKLIWKFPQKKAYFASRIEELKN